MPGTIKSRRGRRIGARRAAAAAFNPAIVAGLVGDWDFSAVSGSDGASIASVTDGSGAGHNATQATAGSRPVLKLAIQNGRSVGRFDGTDDYLQAAFTHTQPSTRFVVCRWRTSPAGQQGAADGATSYQAAGPFSTGGADKVFLYAGAFVGGPTDAGLTETWHVYTLVFDNLSCVIRIDGAAFASGNGGTASADGVTIGAVGGGTAPAPVDIGRVLEYTGHLSGPNLATIETGLKSQWGTP